MSILSFRDAWCFPKGISEILPFVDDSQFSRFRESFNGDFNFQRLAFTADTPVKYQFHRTSALQVFGAGGILMLLKAAFYICRDTGIQAVITAADNVHPPNQRLTIFFHDQS